MFQARWTPRATLEYQELQRQTKKARESRHSSGKEKSSRQEGLFKQVHKAVRLLLGNPKHPGLQTHAYHSLTSPFGKNAKVFEAYVQNRTPGAYRIFWCYGPGKREITILAITPHP